MKTKVQLELFSANDELTLMRKELSEIYRQQKKIERELRSKHHMLWKICLELKEENEVLRRRIDELEKRSSPEKQEQDSNLLAKLFEEAYFPLCKKR